MDNCRENVDERCNFRASHSFLTFDSSEGDAPVLRIPMASLDFGRRPADSVDIELFPRVVPEGWSGTLTVRGAFEHSAFPRDEEIDYSLKSFRWSAANPRGKGAVTGTVVADDQSVLTIPFTPDAPGEWHLELTPRETVSKKHYPATASLFVQHERFRGLMPFLGELHSHTTHSDGRETPVYCGLKALEYGHDFYALTDHRSYVGGKRARDGLARIGLDSLLVLMGEEMHPENEALRENRDIVGFMYHLVAVGQSRGIMDEFRKDPDRSNREVEEIVAELSVRSMHPGIDLAVYAEAIWKTRKARELGGIVLFSHPTWSWPMHLDTPSYEQFLADREFDAIEAMTGVDTTTISENRWSSPQQKTFPVVGVSDRHHWGPGAPPGPCTYVLAPELTREAVLDAIRDRRSLAFDADGRGHIVGPWELVEFAEFYLTRVWPHRRTLKQAQAALGLTHLRLLSQAETFAPDWESTGTGISETLVAAAHEMNREAAEFDQRSYAW